MQGKGQTIFKLQMINIFLLIASIFCSNQNYNPHLVEYLRAEMELRKRVSIEQGLEDSINVLQKKYRIDLKKEFARLSDQPQAWYRLIKELRSEK